MSDPAVEAAARRLARYEVQSMQFGISQAEIDAWIDREWKTFYGKALAAIGAYKTARNKPHNAMVRVVEELAAEQPGWDRRPLSLAHEIRLFLLEAVADQDTAVDSGGGDGIADLWVKIQGVEYHIAITCSKR